MKKHIILQIFVLLFVVSIQAQKEITYEIPQWHLGVEFGVNPHFGTLSYQPNIRDTRRSYVDIDDDYYGRYSFLGQSSYFSSFSVGIKPEYVIKKRLTIAAGLRVQFYKATLDLNQDFFLWKLSETETSTNYVKIQNISQANYYLEIPIEVRLFPREKDYIARQYFVFGAAFNFLVASTEQVNFVNPKMDKYRAQVLADAGRANNFFASVYAGIGLKLGKMNYPFGNIEIHFPEINFGTRKLSLTNIVDVSFIRFFTTLNIPVAKKHKLVYEVID